NTPDTQAHPYVSITGSYASLKSPLPLLSLTPLNTHCEALAALAEASSNLNKELILAIIIFVIGVTIAIGGIFSLFCNSYIITALLIFAVELIGNAVFFSSGLYPLAFLVFQVLDQATWQGILSSEPENGGFNLLASGVFFFPVAVTFGTACGLGYMALNMSYGQIMLPRFMEKLEWRYFAPLVRKSYSAILFVSRTAR
ncbi:hypothetical protein ACTXT7_001481, partial [Hymenolepis weldensis]